MSADVTQRYIELGLQEEGLTLKEREVKVRELEASIKADYPNVWQVAGGAIKHSTDRS